MAREKLWKVRTPESTFDYDHLVGTPLPSTAELIADHDYFRTFSQYRQRSEEEKPVEIPGDEDFVGLEESGLLTEQVNRAHQDVLETLHKMAAIEDPGHHPLLKQDLSVPRENTRPDTPVLEERRKWNRRRRPKRNDSRSSATISNSGSPSNASGSDSSSSQRPFGTTTPQAPQAPPHRRLNLGSPPIMPLVVPGFTRKSKRLPQARANLHFVLELPQDHHQQPQRGGLVYSPCSPLPLLITYGKHNPLGRASAKVALETYFFHGIPIQFFERFFLFEKYLQGLTRKTDPGNRGSLLWNIPELFGADYKYRHLVEKVWEVGELGLRSSWVDSGGVGFASGFLALLGTIAEAMVEDVMPDSPFTKLKNRNGRGKDEMTIAMDLTVVVRQWSSPHLTSPSPFGRSMDIRRLRRKEVIEPRGVPTWNPTRKSDRIGRPYEREVEPHPYLHLERYLYSCVVVQPRFWHEQVLVNVHKARARDSGVVWGFETDDSRSSMDVGWDDLGTL